MLQGVLVLVKSGVDGNNTVGVLRGLAPTFFEIVVVSELTTTLMSVTKTTFSVDNNVFMLFKLTRLIFEN